MNTYHIYTARMRPAFNGSSALERLECSNAIKIRNGIMFDFYPGLPHIVKLQVEVVINVNVLTKHPLATCLEQHMVSCVC